MTCVLTTCCATCIDGVGIDIFVVVNAHVVVAYCTVVEFFTDYCAVDEGCATCRFRIVLEFEFESIVFSTFSVESSLT